MSDLLNKIVRLAHAKPELRRELLPLITKSRTKKARFFNDATRDAVLDVLRKQRGLISFYRDGYIVTERADYTFLVGKGYLSIDGITTYHPLLHKVVSELYRMDPSIGDMVIRTDSPLDVSWKVSTYVERYKRDVPLLRRFQQTGEVLYHGTSSDSWKAISKKGLRPRRMTSQEAVYGMSSGASPSDPRFVYLATSNAENAAHFAAREAAAKHGGDPVIICLFSSSLDMSRAFPDEDSGATTWQESVQKIGTLAYGGVIFPKHLIPVSRWDKDSRSWVHWNG